MIVEHSGSGETQVALGPLHWLWCFLFGFLYYLGKGMWVLAILSLLTINGLFVVMPLLNRMLVRDYYVRAGFRIVQE